MTTIQGTLQNPDSTPQTNCFVRFWLRGCNGNQPRVGGVALIAPDNGPTYFQDYTPNSSGVLSGSIYSNDTEISAGGQVGVTWWGVQVFVNGIGGVETPYSLQNGTTFNLNTATPISTNPVVAAPTGDTTYVRLDAGNITSAANPFVWSVPIKFKTANNIRHADQFATLAAALADLSSGGTVLLSPNTTYTISSTITVSQDGVSIIGFDHTSVLNITTTSDAFAVTGALFNLRNCRVDIGTASSRNGSAVVHATNATGSQGTLENVRFNGNGSSADNGMIFFSDQPGNTLWKFRTLRVVGGVTWQSILKLKSGTSTTISSTNAFDISGSASYTEGGIVCDGSIDTVTLTGCDLESNVSGGGPILWCKNTPATSINPRQIAAIGCTFANSSASATAACVVLDNSRGVQLIGGFIGGPNDGVKIGTHAIETELNGVNFLNVSQNGITDIHTDQGFTKIANCSFVDIGGATNNTYDAIQIANNVNDVSLINNGVRLLNNSNKVRYGINVIGTANDSLVIVGNDIPVAAVATAQILNGSTSASINIIGNPNFPNTLKGAASSLSGGLLQTSGALSVTGSTGLAASAGGTNFIAGNIGSPSNIRIYSGDGTGWQTQFAKRTGSTDTVQVALQDNGLMVTYNSLATAGNGLASIHASTSQKSESAADTNVLTYTPPSVVGRYRVTFSMDVSAQNTATLGWTATWKDSNGSAQAPTNLSLFTAGTAAPALTVTAATNGHYDGHIDIDTDASGTNIVVKLTFTGTSFTAKVSATVERLI